MSSSQSQDAPSSSGSGQVGLDPPVSPRGEEIMDVSPPGSTLDPGSTPPYLGIDDMASPTRRNISVSSDELNYIGPDEEQGAEEESEDEDSTSSVRTEDLNRRATNDKMFEGIYK